MSDTQAHTLSHTQWHVRHAARHHGKNMLGPAAIVVVDIQHSIYQHEPQPLACTVKSCTGKSDETPVPVGVEVITYKRAGRGVSVRDINERERERERERNGETYTHCWSLVSVMGSRVHVTKPPRGT